MFLIQNLHVGAKIHKWRYVQEFVMFPDLNEVSHDWWWGGR